MLEFLVDNIFVVFAGKVFQQIVGIPMGTNCAPLLADIFLYSYEAEFIQSLLSTGRKQLASRFNFTYRYIDDVLSINNPEFENYQGQMYPVELEIKDTTGSNTSASYLDLLLSIVRDGQLHTSIYDKCDDFNFHITNFPFLSSNFLTSPAYGVFILQLIRYARAWSSYGCFILRATRLSNKLLEQGYVKERLKSSLRKFYGRYGDLIKQYEVSLSQMLNDILWLDHIQWPPPTDETFYRTRPFTEYWVVSIEHLRRVWHADRGRLNLRTPGPVPLGLAYVLLVETNPFPNLSLFYRTMLFEYPSVFSRFCFQNSFYTVDTLVNRGVAVATPIARLKSVRNRSVIEVLDCVFCVVTLLFAFSMGAGAFVIGLSQISLFFSCYCKIKKKNSRS